MSAEPDAAWYVREEDHRDRGSGDDRGRGYRKVTWGWEATLAVMSTNDPAASTEEFPYLVAGIGFGKPGHDVSGHGGRTFASIRERGHPTGYVIGDRAYFPNSIATDLQLPLRALGYRLVFDYREDQLGLKENFAGAIQVEGEWYCPSMPQALVNATVEYRVTKSIDEDTWRKRIVQRRVYRLRPKERPDHDGHVPLRCPAAGPRATVTCPLKHPAKRPVGPTGSRATIILTPTHPDRICVNDSVSFPPSAGAKYGQALAYGSEQWQAMYATARNTIEGFNGYVKDANHEALDQPGRRRLRGYAAQYVLVALLVMSANVRKLTTYLARAVPTKSGVVARVAKRRARRRDRLGDYRPKTAVPTGADPPAA